jgi:hypothetical protein
MQKKFKQKNYLVIKKAISKELANFVYEYFLLKREVAKTLFKTNYLTPYETFMGYWESENDQIPNTYSHYADIAMETLLTRVQPIMEEHTGVKLIPTYSYARIYKKGDELKRHKDRFSCEISTTLNLGGDNWPIYLEPYKNIGIPGKDNATFSSKNKGVQINLEPGDMLVYKGNILEHWREPFKGNDCGQVFLHYNNVKTKGALKNKFDGRPHLGLPGSFKTK